MWTHSTHAASEADTLHLQVGQRGTPLTYQEVLRLWQQDRTFAAYFTRLLAEAPYAAFRWETPPLTLASRDQPFECVLIDAPKLDRFPDPSPFFDALSEIDGPIATFPNLGGDALLIVPRPLGTTEGYAHLAAFCRTAPPEQQVAFWGGVGAAVRQELGAAPRWLSTAGMGVPWLHARVDQRPKYYHHSPYRTAP